MADSGKKHTKQSEHVSMTKLSTADRYWRYHLAWSFKIFTNMFAFLYLKTNSMEICEEISFPTDFFRKMLMLAFLLRFRANYLETLRGYPSFSLRIPIALAKIYFFVWS